MRKTYIPIILTTLLVVSNIYLWSSISNSKSNLLKVSFLDVGQGDSIFIEAPNGVQMIIDGGKGKSVLTELGKVMSSYDKEIDILVATHPDADHIEGLMKVLENFNIKNIVVNGDKGDTVLSERFNRIAEEENVLITEAAQGMRIILDNANNVYFDIFYPTSGIQSEDTNSLSIVGRLVYGSREFLLTGDAPFSVEQELIKWCKVCLSSDVLKAGHHGSKTSTSKSFVASVSPLYSVISAGKDNSYGHPHSSVLETLKSQNILVLGTYASGTIVFETNGESLNLR